MRTKENFVKWKQKLHRGFRKRFWAIGGPSALFKDKHRRRHDKRRRQPVLVSHTTRRQGIASSSRTFWPLQRSVGVVYQPGLGGQRKKSDGLRLISHLKILKDKIGSETSTFQWGCSCISQHALLFSLRRLSLLGAVYSRNSPQPYLDPPNQNGTKAKGRKMRQ